MLLFVLYTSVKTDILQYESIIRLHNDDDDDDYHDNDDNNNNNNNNNKADPVIMIMMDTDNYIYI